MTAAQVALWPTGPTARPSDPDTATDAGRRPWTDSALHLEILDLHRGIGATAPGGLTDDELCQLITRCEGTTKKRRTELTKAGLLVDSGERRPTRTGTLAIVWRTA